MRKFYFLLSFLFFAPFFMAQTNLPGVNPKPLNHNIDLKKNKPINNKTVNCTDTVEYPISKLTGLPEVDTLDIATYISGTAQVYNFSGSGTLSGISAHVYLDLDGVPGNSSPIIMTIKVYNVNAANEPSTLIDSADVQVMDVGFHAQALMFISPVSISDTFAIALELNAAFPANPYYVTNTSLNNDGNGEKLSSAEYLGVWYNAFDDFGGWDMDCLLSPIFTTDITSLYTVGPTTFMCPNDTLIFLNASTVNTDGMFNMYNSSTNPLYEWDFDDGTGIYTPYDTNYVYNAPGSYNTSLTVNYYGYTQNCFETSNVPITVFDTAISYFSWQSSPPSTVINFTDSSSNAMIYSWDFGDGSPLDSTQNPSHSFPLGSGTVCLTVTDSNGCNQNTYCDVVIISSVSDIDEPKQINIYPIPANKYFNVSIPSIYFGGDVVITNVVGEKIKAVAIENQEKIKVLTEGISSGIYFVSIDLLGERVYTKRIVIDK